MSLQTYRNNPQTAAQVGWVDLDEYFVGDTSADFVVHDHHRGLFIFTSECGRPESLVDFAGARRA